MRLSTLMSVRLLFSFRVLRLQKTVKHENIIKQDTLRKPLKIMRWKRKFQLYKTFPGLGLTAAVELDSGANIEYKSTLSSPTDPFNPLLLTTFLLSLDSNI